MDMRKVAREVRLSKRAEIIREQKASGQSIHAWCAANDITKRNLIDYCLTYSDIFEDYPFDENWTAMRHSGGKKSFAFIYEHDGRLCANLKCNPMKADFLRQVYKSVTPAYHMNKEHWNTVTIGGDVPETDLFEMISHSYELTKKKESNDECIRVSQISISDLIMICV